MQDGGDRQVQLLGCLSHGWTMASKSDTGLTALRDPWSGPVPPTIAAQVVAAGVSEAGFVDWVEKMIVSTKAELGVCETMGEVSHEREVWSMIVQIGPDANAVWLHRYRHLGAAGTALFAFGFALERDWPSVSAEIGATIGTFVVDGGDIDHNGKQHPNARSCRDIGEAPCL